MIIPDKKLIDISYNNICKHKLFSNSPRNTKILKYLISQALLGNNVKEYTIGIELFNQNYSEEKSDGVVRVYMYKLRKRLKEYYEFSDVKDPIIFQIKKGQYNLSFITKEDYYNKIKNASSIRESKKDIAIIENNSKKKDYEISTNNITFSLKTSTLKIAIAITFIMLLSIIYILLPKTKNTYCWKPFLKKESENLCVMSDQLIIRQRGIDKKIYPTIIYEIRDKSDLLKTINENPKRELYMTDYTLLSKMAPFSIHKLTKWFSINNKDFELSLESTFNLDDIRKKNILFIGQFKTMTTSKAIFLKDSKVFSIFKDGFLYSKNDTNKTYRTKWFSNTNLEYAMVSYTTLQSGKKALFFVSNNDIGVMATVRHFCDMKWLKKFTNRLPSEDAKFNALFQVSGVQRTDISFKLIKLETFN